jgi:hypothetical protein
MATNEIPLNIVTISESSSTESSLKLWQVKVLSIPWPPIKVLSRLWSRVKISSTLWPQINVPQHCGHHKFSLNTVPTGEWSLNTEGTNESFLKAVTIKKCFLKVVASYEVLAIQWQLHWKFSQHCATTESSLNTAPPLKVPSTLRHHWKFPQHSSHK